LVDAELYQPSWNEAAAYFQSAVSVEQWQQSLETVRKPLGQNLSRKVKSKQYSTSLPSASRW
jgi:hypothetical protein